MMTARDGLSRTAVVSILVGFVFSVAVGFALGEPLAQINLLSVSPRDVAASDTDEFDVVASGLNAVGVGQKVYLQAVPEEGVTIGGYEWSITSRPRGSGAPLSAASGELVTFRPDVIGPYTITLTPLDGSMQPTESTNQTLYAATWAGAGVFNTHAPPYPIAPNCGTGFCHGGNNAKARLNVLDEWIQSKHAQKLQNHMNGVYGSHYAVSCLSCHTVGFDESAVNGGFDDVANSLSYDLSQIPLLVHDAATSDLENFLLLPAELQNLASIQCESCHGAGSLHPANLLAPDHGIAGANLSPKACAQCHDSATGRQQGFYQWNASSHPLTAAAAEGHASESASCLKCHTGEGFVDVRVKGLPPTVIENPNPITCSVCHDPHYSSNEHQLRIAGDFTLDSGDTFVNAGLGGLCMRCHNSRVSDAQSTANSSYRGAHHGPQADMLLGVNGVSFHMPFEANSLHGIVVEDTCVHCHMAEPSQSGSGITEPPKVGSHTFSMRDTMGTADPADDEINVTNACSSCHGSLTTYDRTARGDYDGDGVVEGTQTEVRGLFDILRPAILTSMPGTAVDEESGKIEIGSGDFANLSDLQKEALYNYNFVWEDGSFGVHNTAYAVQLLQRSYWGIFGRPINVDYPNIALRGPVQEQVAQYDFDTSLENWSFSTVTGFALPTSGYAGGLISLTSAPDDVNRFGYLVSQPGSIPYEANKIFRGRFHVRTDQTTPLDVPTIRLRWMTQNFEANAAHSIHSVGPVTYVPGSDSFKEYRTYFYPPVAQDMNVAFDLLDFSPSDSGTIFLDSVEIDKIARPGDVGTGKIVKIYDTAADFATWTFNPDFDGAFGSVTSANWGSGSPGLSSTTANGYNAGFISGPPNDCSYDTSAPRLYRVTYRLSSVNDADRVTMCPIRMRCQNEDNQMTQTMGLTNGSEGAAMPRTTGTSYEVYWETPTLPASPGTGEDGFFPALDLLDFDPGLGGQVNLEGITIEYF